MSARGAPAGPAAAALGAAGALVAVGDRHLGDASFDAPPDLAAASRRRTLEPVGGALERSVWMRQVHGTRVATVTAADAGRGARGRDDAVADADALVTAEADLALGVLVADCAPVALAAEHGPVAAVHAGRRGIVAGVLDRTVEALADLGADPGRLTAVVGPAIGGCCYALPEPDAAEVAEAAGVEVTTSRDGQASVDVASAAATRLTALGVAAVQRLGGCTACAGGWHSHRRDATRGRQAMVVRRAPLDRVRGR